MTVLVTGAGGTLGSAAVPRLVKEDHRGTADEPLGVGRLGCGGLAAVVGGVDAIVHLVSSATRPQVFRVGDLART